VTTTRRGGDGPTGPSESPGRLGFSDLGDSGANNFDALRFLLAALVILSHSCSLFDGDSRRDPLARLTGGQMAFGGLAVDGFFVLSGFLIRRSWLRDPRPLPFLRKRALRIYPGFLAAVALGAFVVGPLGWAGPSSYWSRFDPSRFVLGALVLQGPTPPVFADLPNPRLNGSLWTITYEFQCYLGLMLLGLAGVLKRRAGTATAFGLAYALYATQAAFAGPGPVNPWPRFAAFFLAGAAFEACRRQIPRSRGLLAAAVAGMAILASVPRWEGLEPALPILGTYALFYLATLPTPRLHRFGDRGDYSYGLYLYAFPIQQLLIRHVGLGRLGPPALFASSFGLAVLLAMASWRFLESPCLRRKAVPARWPSLRPRLDEGHAAGRMPHLGEGRPARVSGRGRSA